IEALRRRADLVSLQEDFSALLPIESYINLLGDAADLQRCPAMPHGANKVSGQQREQRKLVLDSAEFDHVRDRPRELGCPRVFCRGLRELGLVEKQSAELKTRKDLLPDVA